MENCGQKRFVSKKLLLLLFLLLFLSGFMGYRGLDTANIIYIFLFLCFAIFSLLIKGPIFKKGIDKYDIFIYAFISLIILSFIPGLFWGGQSLYYSLRGAFGVLYIPIFLYVFLQKKSYSEIDINRCLLILFFIYLIIYAYSYLIFPQIKFSFNSNDVDLISRDYATRGVLRLFIPFEDLITLGVLYFINNPSKHKITNIVIFVFLSILTFLRGTRSLMFLTIFFSGLLFLKQIKTGRKAYIFELLVAVILVFSLFFSLNFSNILESYKDIFEKDIDMGSDYIRWAMADYYINDYNSSIFEYLFGHGIPIKGSFKQDLTNNNDIGFFPDDIGYVELFLNFGILGLLVLGTILVILVKTKITSRCYYAKYYLYYLFLASFFGRYILSNMALFAMMLYVVKISKLQYENQR